VTSGLALLLLGAGTANAAEPAAGWTPAIEVESGGEVTTAIDVRGMFPGLTRDVIVFVADSGSGAAPIRSMAVRVVDLEDLENGCNASEVAADDTTCGDGPDQGELSTWLLTTFRAGTTVVTDAGRACRTEPPADAVRGRLSDLGDDDEASTIPRPAGVADGRPWCIVASFHHEFRDVSANQTQGDTVRFGLELTASGLPAPEVSGSGDGGAPTEVSGGVIERSPTGAAASPVARTVVAGQIRPAGTSQTLGLAETGGRILELVAVGMLLVSVGWLASRPRRAATRWEVR
jgi:hypothetical protein